MALTQTSDVARPPPEAVDDQFGVLLAGRLEDLREQEARANDVGNQAAATAIAARIRRLEEGGSAARAALQLVEP